MTGPLPLLRLAGGVSSFDRFVTPALLVSMARDLGVDLATMSAAATMYFLLYGGMQPVWAVVSDRFGRVGVIRAALLAAACCGVVCLFAGSVEVVVVARAAAGAVFAAVVPATLVWIGESLDGDGRKAALSKLLSATSTGTLLASVVGALASQFDVWRAAIAVSTAAAAAVGLLLLRTPNPVNTSGQGLLAAARHGLTRPQALLVIGIAFVEGAVVQGCLTYWPAALQSLGTNPAVAGLAVACFGLGVVAGSRRVGVTRWPRRTVMLTGGATITAALTLAAFTGRVGPAAMLVAAVVLGVGFSALHASLQGWATEAAPEARALVIALFASALFTGGAVFTAFGATAAAAGDFGRVFAVAAVVAVPMTLLTLTSRTR